MASSHETQKPQAILHQGKRNWLALIVALAAPFAAAAIGARATNNSVNTWYKTLRKPAWNPPSWVFGPVWTVLYTMMGIASWLVWRSSNQSTTPNATDITPSKQQAVKGALALYGVHLVLNTLWSVLFFGQRNIKWAFIELVVLWSMIVATLTSFYRIRRTAGLLLVPYLLWCSFAAVLNATIWRMNRHNFLAQLWEKPFWRRG
ncbi:hypothetical protein BH10CHL1_BH10CHL1_41130 [soil metagenome]